MTKKSSPAPGFTPVALRRRHNGWTADKQLEFIEALAQTACVEEACARIGMGRTAAYALRARSDAVSFRIAWDAALGVGIKRLTDAVIGRAINGTSRPVFYKGELVGERRFYNDRLAMFLLRYRDPSHYGKWRDQAIHQRGPDTESDLLTQAVHNMMMDAAADELGLRRTPQAPLALDRTIDQGQWEAERAARETPNKGGT